LLMIERAKKGSVRPLAYLPPHGADRPPGDTLCVLIMLVAAGLDEQCVSMRS